MKLATSIILLTTLLQVTNPLKLNTHNSADTLNENERLDSSSQKYFAILQGDGNFVIYSTGSTNGRGKDHRIWSTNTMGKGTTPRKVVMQKDGNLVLYDATNSPKWASNTNGRGAQPYNLIMQDDGNLVIYAQGNKPVWASNTMGKK